MSGMTEVCIVCDWTEADPFPRFIEAEIGGASVSLPWRDRPDGLKELVIAALSTQPAPSAPSVAYWCAVQSDQVDGYRGGIVEFGMSADDANKGEAAREEVNQWINDQPNPWFYRLVGMEVAR